MAGEERLRSLRKLLDSAQRALYELDEDARVQREQEFERLEATLAYLSVALERTDPMLLSNGAHAELTRLLETAGNNPASAAANPDSFTDALMQQAALLPPAQDRGLEQAGREAASSLRRSASQHINALTEEAEALRERLDEIKQQAEEADTGAKAAHETSTAELRQELTSIKAGAEAAQKQVEDLADSFEQSFEKEQATREEVMAESWTKTRQEIQQEAQELVADLGRMREDAQGLVGAVSVATTANHFRSDASSERTSYWLLLVATVAALALAVYFAGTAASHPDLEFERVLAKLGVSAALVGLGVFTGSRAKDHREREKRSRDKELDMRVFGPFIEPLPAKEQVRERILMARRFFGRTAPEAPDQTDEQIELLSSPEELEIVARDMRRRDTSAPDAATRARP